MPSHYQNQCCIIVNWTPGNKLQWNHNQNVYIFIQENAFANVVCEMTTIFSRPQCVDYGLFIFLILAQFWLRETGQICGFWAFPRECIEGMNRLKFHMLMYPDHLHNWLDFGHALMISLIMVPLWLSETGHIWGLWALSGEHLGVNVEGGTETYFQCFESSSVVRYWFYSQWYSQTVI